MESSDKKKRVTLGSSFLPKIKGRGLVLVLNTPLRHPLQIWRHVSSMGFTHRYVFSVTWCNHFTLEQSLWNSTTFYMHFDMCRVNRSFCPSRNTVRPGCSASSFFANCSQLHTSMHMVFNPTQLASVNLNAKPAMGAGELRPVGLNGVVVSVHWESSAKVHEMDCIQYFSHHTSHITSHIDIEAPSRDAHEAMNLVLSLLLPAVCEASPSSSSCARMADGMDTSPLGP